MEKKYLRLLSYDNACKVIQFVNHNSVSNYANFVPHGVAIESSEESWGEIKLFIESLNVRYEISDQEPYKVVEEIKKNIKSSIYG